MNSFWGELPRPFVGLSAMDGVTDASMREITAVYGHPDFMLTEFVSAEGIVRGIPRLLRDLYFTPRQRPIVAQIFGSSPEAFKLAAQLCCFLGFDGVDLNMGCPADTVAKKGGGAALIKQPLLAQRLIKAAKRGVKEFSEGFELKELALPDEFVKLMQQNFHLPVRRKLLPVSVKTRLGYDKPIVSEWIPRLLEANPAVITLHGRTLVQQYGGRADWGEIAKAAVLTHQTNTLIIGNGDLTTPEEIVARIQESNVDGVCIGRRAMGNPWIFSQYREFVRSGKYQTPSKEQRTDLALKHAQMFEKFNHHPFSSDPLPFLNMRKHLGWYIKGFPNVSELRQALFQTNSSVEVKWVLASHLAADPAKRNLQ